MERVIRVPSHFCNSTSQQGRYPSFVRYNLQTLLGIVCSEFARRLSIHSYFRQVCCSIPEDMAQILRAQTFSPIPSCCWSRQQLQTVLRRLAIHLSYLHTVVYVVVSALYGAASCAASGPYRSFRESFTMFPFVVAHTRQDLLLPLPLLTPHKLLLYFIRPTSKKFPRSFVSSISRRASRGPETVTTIVRI